MPSLRSLWIFEAAARHSSFKKAAEELAVTPVAITHQIKVLEGDLGLCLFTRGNHSVELTEAGKSLQREITTHIAGIRKAVAEVRHRAAKRQIRIGVDDAFSERWLQPRLDEFHALHEGIEIVLELPGHSGCARDGTIYYGASFIGGNRCHTLFDELVFPVCSREYLNAHRNISDISNLTGHQMIHEGGVDWWLRWLQMANVQDVDVANGVVFLSPDEVHKSVIAGEGIAIGDDILFSADLTAGRLVRPFKPVVSGGSYALTYHRPEDEPMAAFRTWLVHACESFKADFLKQIEPCSIGEIAVAHLQFASKH